MNALGAATTIEAGSELRVPSAVKALPPQVLQAAARVDSRGRTRNVRAVHVVRRGDSLWSIARRHNMDVVTLATPQPHRPERHAALRTEAEAAPLAALSASGVVSDDGHRVTYVVQRGDTLSGIARTLRVSVANLRSWNDLNGSVIKPGQRLVAYVQRGT